MNVRPIGRKRAAFQHMGAWSLSKGDESEPRNPIELHGTAYIAFCKPWAPVWVDEESLDAE